MKTLILLVGWLALVVHADRNFLLKEVLSILPGDDALALKSAAFLIRYMPENDVMRLNPDFISRNIMLALQAHREFEWNVSDRMFLNDVLPYASLTEPRDDWRRVFKPFMSGLVQHCGTNSKCAANELNQRAWHIVDPPIVFEAAPSNTLNSYGPFETMARHNSSCTGMALFLVDALRSIGIPARVAGTPHWNKGSIICPNGDADAECGNHNWVEAFLQGEWHFMDQGNSKIVDVGWFFPKDTDMQDNTFNHSIYSTSWAPSSEMSKYPNYELFEISDFYPMVWEWTNHQVNGFNMLSWYHHNRKQIESIN